MLSWKHLHNYCCWPTFLFSLWPYIIYFWSFAININFGAIFVKTRDISLPLLNESASETQGAQWHILTNIYFWEICNKQNPQMNGHQLFLLFFISLPCELTVIYGMKTLVVHCPCVPIISYYTQNVFVTDGQM